MKTDAGFLIIDFFETYKTEVDLQGLEQKGFQPAPQTKALNSEVNVCIEDLIILI